MLRLIWLALFTVLVARSCYATKPPITAVAFAVDGNSIVHVSQTGARVLNWPDLTLRKTIDVDAANLHCLAFSPHGRQLAIGGGDPSENGVIYVFSWPTTKLIARLDAHFDSVRSIVWQDDQRLFSASLDREILDWNIRRPNQPHRRLRGHSRAVDSIVLLDGAKTLVSAGVDQSVRVWDVNSGRLVRSLNQHTKPIHSLAIRPTANGLPMVASAAEDYTVRFWQPTIGRMVRYVRLEAKPLSIAWLRDGSRLLAACMDGQVRFIDPDEVKVTQSVPALTGWAYAIAVHPTEAMAVVGGTDGQLERIAIESNRQ